MRKGRPKLSISFPPSFHLWWMNRGSKGPRRE
ncbi:hypothetical protein Taro_007053 [Colocasia esculenta]|uniref:Uncharacterized protein n=1 Tax=Colocasia esculenta TaxID=4460 RepID=A0A843TSZ0_COLES|nr:hypothetical protein [Colocasia esculenta]